MQDSKWIQKREEQQKQEKCIAGAVQRNSIFTFHESQTEPVNSSQII